MGREIITRNDVGAAGGAGGMEEGVATGTTEYDDYKSKVVKYIPAEVVTVYLTIDLAVGTSNLASGAKQVVLWAVSAFLLIGTWLYLRRVNNVTKTIQLAVSTGAFAVWVFALGGPFAALSWYEPVYGAILLPLYTFGVAVINPERSGATPTR